MLFSAASTLKTWMWVGAVTLGLTLAGTGLWKWETFKKGIFDEGFKAGQGASKAEEVKRLEAENEGLRNEQRLYKLEIARQLEVATTVQAAYAKATNSADRLSRDLAASQRLRDNNAKAFDGQLAKSSAESCRQYAKTAGDNFRRCTSHVSRFGQEAVRSSAAAHAAVAGSNGSVVGIPEPDLPPLPAIPEE
jgi:hypothetical protein